MRKLLALTLVLGMATVANAALVLSVDEDTTQNEIIINEGDTVSIGINNTDAGWYDAFLGFGYVSEGGFVVSSLIYLWPPDSTYPPWPQEPIIYDDVIWYYINFILFDPLPEPCPPGMWITIDLTCMSAGVDVFVVLCDDALVTLDTLIIHQVPEPGTIALLGLGGLFLLRRRR